MVEPDVHGKYVYSTLALGKEREIVKEETDRKKQYAVMYMCSYSCELELVTGPTCVQYSKHYADILELNFRAHGNSTVNLYRSHGVRVSA